MRRWQCCAAGVGLLMAVCCGGAAAGDGDASLTLHYDSPGKQWLDALPLGNGRLGVMVFGGVDDARFQFNEDTLWAYGPHDYAHPGAVEVLPELRKLLYAGKQKEAQDLATKRFMSVPLRQVAYQAFGDLHLNFDQSDPRAKPTDYHRQLDLNNAVATTTYRLGSVTYTRRTFVSHPDQVIVVHITADKPHAISFTAKLTSPQPHPTTKAIDDHTLAINGHAADFHIRGTGDVKSVLTYQARVQAHADGGDVHAADDTLTVKHADAVTLTLAAATSYVNYHDVSADPAARCAATLKAIAGKSFDAMRDAHIADYQHLFNRVTISLGKTDPKLAAEPTDQRLKNVDIARDPQLVALLFQYGRYLLIASSREPGQPANLQGLWNDSLTPPWDSKYTININTEMNYWPAEVTNLGECTEPLFDALDDLSHTGHRVAEVHYGAPGWVVHHNFDLWRGAAPINGSNHGIWVVGGAWLCQHLWWHYQFTHDKAFLRNRAYPLLKGASEFFLHDLTPDPRDPQHHLISGPSNSPEHGGLVMGPTMDHEIIRYLLTATADAAKILDVDPDFRKQLIETRDRIAPFKIGRYGQLQEWLEDKDDPKDTHRHVSHLWAVFPGNEISVQTPKLLAAAEKSLQMRGDGGTGWSKAWKINIHARMRQPENAADEIRSLLASNCAPDLLDRISPHSAFQIDANFGVTSGIAELLLQSDLTNADGTRIIDLLPALPKEWPDGHVTGLCARGGFVVDITWKSGKLDHAVLHARAGGPVAMQYDGHTFTLNTQAGHDYPIVYSHGTFEESH